ncbi:MAG: hypothetical protein NVSMB22_18110 [Chloroflexota bacterium]
MGRLAASSIYRIPSPIEPCIHLECCGDTSIRDKTLHHLAESGDLVAVRVEGASTRCHAPTSALSRLNLATQDSEMRFVAPLDGLLWDRSSVREIFDFDYV